MPKPIFAHLLILVSTALTPLASLAHNIQVDMDPLRDPQSVLPLALSYRAYGYKEGTFHFGSRFLENPYFMEFVFCHEPAGGTLGENSPVSSSLRERPKGVGHPTAPLEPVCFNPFVESGTSTPAYLAKLEPDYVKKLEDKGHTLKRWGTFGGGILAPVGALLGVGFAPLAFWHGLTSVKKPVSSYGVGAGLTLALSAPVIGAMGVLQECQKPGNTAILRASVLKEILSFDPLTMAPHTTSSSSQGETPNFFQKITLVKEHFGWDMATWELFAQALNCYGV